MHIPVFAKIIQIFAKRENPPHNFAVIHFSQIGQISHEFAFFNTLMIIFAFLVKILRENDLVIL